ncbi:hypothetical protein JCM16303_004571 [Sporobolomyces ruberrimus]
MLRLFALLYLAGRVLAGDIPITAQSSVAPNEQLAISWTSDSPKYTVRILVNKSQVDEIKSIKEATFAWQATRLKPGDQIQFWVYDSAGNAGKTAYLPVLETSLTHSGGSEDGFESVTASDPKDTVTATGTAGEDDVTETWDLGHGPAVTGAATNVSSLAPSVTGLEDVATGNSTSVALTNSGSVSTSVSSFPSGTTASGTSSTSSPTSSSEASSPSSSSSSDESDSETSDNASSSNTVLYIGIGAVVLALILGIAFFFWWRQRKQSETASKDPESATTDSGKNAGGGGGKDSYNYQAAGKEDYSDSELGGGDSLSEEEDDESKKKKSKSYSMGKRQSRGSSRRSRRAQDSSASDSGSSGSASSSDNDRRRRHRK